MESLSHEVWNRAWDRVEVAKFGKVGCTPMSELDEGGTLDFNWARFDGLVFLQVRRYWRVGLKHWKREM